jgi:ATP-dependent helicase YprA (DUF1998 family)
MRRHSQRTTAKIENRKNLRGKISEHERDFGPGWTPRPVERAVIMLGLSAALACAYQLAPPLAQPRVPQRRAPPPAASSFAEIGLRGELCAALEEAGITEPNDLQRRVMPALAGRADVLIGARTGSGKTLAYLLPIMQTLRTDEEQGGSRARARRPRALVLLPTRELALQVRDVARSLCRPLKISVAAVHGGVPEGSQKRMLEQPVDALPEPEPEPEP